MHLRARDMDVLLVCLNSKLWYTSVYLPFPHTSLSAEKSKMLQIPPPIGTPSASSGQQPSSCIMHKQCTIIFLPPLPPDARGKRSELPKSMDHRLPSILPLSLPFPSLTLPLPKPSLSCTHTHAGVTHVTNVPCTNE